jgi:hypothetical protein
MSNSWYFRHDYKAKSDSKILELEIEFGEHVGYALWFKLLECMGESNGILPTSKIAVAAFSMRIDKDTMQSFLDYCVKIGLLYIESDCYLNLRFKSQCEGISERSKKASESAKARWEKQPEQKPKPIKSAKEKKEKQQEITLTPAQAEEIQRLRGYVANIQSEMESKRKYVQITDAQYLKLIASYGDRLPEAQKLFFTWYFEKDKMPNVIPYRVLVKENSWVREKLNQIPVQQDEKPEPKPEWTWPFPKPAEYDTWKRDEKVAFLHSGGQVFPERSK